MILHSAAPQSNVKQKGSENLILRFREKCTTMTPTAIAMKGVFVVLIWCVFGSMPSSLNIVGFRDSKKSKATKKQRYPAHIYDSFCKITNELHYIL